MAAAKTNAAAKSTNLGFFVLAMQRYYSIIRTNPGNPHKKRLNGRISEKVRPKILLTSPPAKRPLLPHFWGLCLKMHENKDFS